MLRLDDRHMRLAFLNYICAQLGEGNPGDLLSCGLDERQLAQLRELSAFNLRCLAAMPQLELAVSVNGKGLAAGLRALGLSSEAKALEMYFLRNGASSRLMAELFRMRRKLTHSRRQQWGVKLPAGNVRLPPMNTRIQIYRAWQAQPERSLRLRYYHLHQQFSQYPIAVLECVVRMLEVTP
jgi:hypothetical protein